MSRKHKELPVIKEVTITDVAAEGKAIVKSDDIVIFTQYTVPGDVVDLQITKKKKNYMEGRVINFHKYSDIRCEAKCEHYGTCGGCKWQILPYEEQLKYKHKQVIDNLTRIGHVELPEANYILGSQHIYEYRNKLEYTFSNRKWLSFEEVGKEHTAKDLNGVGLHIPGMFDKVLDIHKCWLQDDISNRIRNSIKEYALNNDLTFFDLRNQEGFLRTLMIRTTSTGELMVVIVFFYEDVEVRKKLLDFICEQFPEITSLQYVINSKCNDTITDQEIIVYKGEEAVYEEMEGLKFKIGPKSFYQTNSLQAYELYKVARNFADLKGDELVYDLYTGTGTIANFVSSKARKVIGIEYVNEAIEDAKINSEINNITNTDFYAGDMKDILTDKFILDHGRPDVIITDPPRAGMHEDVVNVILHASPRKIVYISCNPATQARDLQLLDKKYKVRAIQPVDMFPHTHHVENVVLLELR